MTSLEKVEQLKAELDRLRPLDAEAEARIMQKFRLDWNYHSNNLEGNSLTYGETKALILFGITAQGKPLKDHFEITGHNEAINWIIEIVAGKTELTEVFIRQLHTLLLKESSYKKAQTPDGKLTRRKIEVGKYKTQPNHVLTQTGETFYFAAPEETPAKMQELVEWFRKEKETPNTNPIILAALFHYKFIRIHPFDDGNGRVARILMNFILMQHGFPPVIIKTEDKENYYAVLRLADADQLEPFIEYIVVNLIRSLEIMIKGAKGEDIEEPDDLTKEIALLERKIRSIGKKVDVPKSKEVILKIYQNSIQHLIAKFIITCQIFDKFYISNELTVFIDGSGSSRYKSKEDVTQKLKEVLETDSASEIHLRYFYNAFNQDSLGDFNFESEILMKFEITKYRISSGINYIKSQRDLSEAAKDTIIYERLYSEQLSEDEIDKIVRLKAKQHKELIDGKFEEYQNITKNKEIMSKFLSSESKE